MCHRISEFVIRCYKINFIFFSYPCKICLGISHLTLITLDIIASQKVKETRKWDIFTIEVPKLLLSVQRVCDWHFGNAFYLIDWLPLTSVKNQTFIVRVSRNVFMHEGSFITFQARKINYLAKRAIDLCENYREHFLRTKCDHQIFDKEEIISN